ncbi:hypothetical protein ACLBYG_01900 [Methylobacterium sp. D53M]|jgi:hypothetical protein
MCQIEAVRNAFNNAPCDAYNDAINRVNSIRPGLLDDAQFIIRICARRRQMARASATNIVRIARIGRAVIGRHAPGTALASHTIDH